jgi:hypothetical protein
MPRQGRHQLQENMNLKDQRFSTKSEGDILGARTFRPPPLRPVGGFADETSALPGMNAPMVTKRR